MKLDTELKFKLILTNTLNSISGFMITTTGKQKGRICGFRITKKIGNLSFSFESWATNCRWVRRQRICWNSIKLDWRKCFWKSTHFKCSGKLFSFFDDMSIRKYQFKIVHWSGRRQLEHFVTIGESQHQDQYHLRSLAPCFVTTNA